MAKQLLHKRTNVPNKIPSSEQISLGEIAINMSSASTRLYTRRSDNTIAQFYDDTYINAELAKKMGEEEELIFTTAINQLNAEKINISAIASVLTSASTNSEVAGAKAVYDSLQDIHVPIASAITSASTNNEAAGAKAVYDGYYTKDEIDVKLSGVTSGETYTKAEIDTKLAGKSDTGHTHSEYSLSGHTHTKSEITDFAHNHDDRYYSTANTYTKEEVDEALSTKMGEEEEEAIAAAIGELETGKIGVSAIASVITSACTNNEVAGAKAVFDSLQDIHVPIASSITSASTNEYAAGAKAVYDALQDIHVPVASSITSASTNEYAAGAKAVYDFTYSRDAIDLALSGKMGEAEERVISESFNDINIKLRSKSDSGHTHDDRYYTTANTYTKAEIDSRLSGKSDTSHTHSEYSLTSHTHSEYSVTGHNHDDRYYTSANTYTKSEIDAELAKKMGEEEELIFTTAINQLNLGKSNTGHTHTKSEITDFAHNHDDRYYTTANTYTKTEVDSSLSGKSDTGHTHSEYSLTSHTHQDIIDKLGDCTSANTAADKSFVNSSIATNTATFRGTSPSGLTEAQFLAWANTLTKDINDYVFWNTKDSDGNTLYKRYKYDGSNWLYEYTLNNSSFTQAQWNAINSTITDTKVNKYEAYDTNKVGTATTVSAGEGLSGGGNLGSNVTLNLGNVAFKNVSGITGTSSTAIARGDHNHDGRYSLSSHTHTKSEITDFAHNHDDRYYTSSAMDTKLAGKSDTGHTHTKSEITDFAHDHDDRYYTSANTYTKSEIDAELSKKMGEEEELIFTTAINQLNVGKSDTGHTHSEYSLTGHNHDGRYSLMGHTHTEYSPTGHNHDERYYTSANTYTKTEVNSLLNGKSDTGHTHSNYSLTSHTHSNYALTGHNHDDRYYTESEIDTKLAGKSDTSHTHSDYSLTGHNHDDRYYTESEIDTKLNGKVNTSAIVSALTSACTDSQIPTAKVVYDEITDNERVTANAINLLQRTKLDAEATAITSTLGNTPVSRATADANGDTITTTYVKSSELLSTILASNITSNGVTLTLQQWIDRISTITIDE